MLSLARAVRQWQYVRIVQAPNSVSMPLNLFGGQRRYFSSRFVPGIELTPRRYNQAIPICHACLNIQNVFLQHEGGVMQGKLFSER